MNKEYIIETLDLKISDELEQYIKFCNIMKEEYLKYIDKILCTNDLINDKNISNKILANRK